MTDDGRVDVSGRAIMRTLWFIFAALFAAHALTSVINRGERWFHLGSEATVPTVFSAAMFLFAAIVVWLIAAAVRSDGGRWWRHWAGLGAVLVFLAIDESTEIHESLIDPLREAWNTSGALFYPWIVPYMIGVGVLGAVYLGFIRDLAPSTRRRFLLAAAVYVFGAVVLEALGGMLISANDGKATFAYRVAQTVEETCEMIGILLFVDAALRELTSTLRGRTLAFTGPAREAEERSAAR